MTWKLDRLGRNLKHLITLLEEIQALGVAFVSLAEGIDATTPAGIHMLGTRAMAVFALEFALLRLGKPAHQRVTELVDRGRMTGCANL